MQPDWRLEKSPDFIKWVGDAINGAYRYAIVVARTGTGVKWIRYYPVVGRMDQRLVYSHGNFYGDSLEEAIASCESAILQLIELGQ